MHLYTLSSVSFIERNEARLNSELEQRRSNGADFEKTMVKRFEVARLTKRVNVFRSIRMTFFFTLVQVIFLDSVRIEYFA